MAEQASMKPGTVFAVDLTVNDAAGVRDFYKGVVGWQDSPVSMGEYDDYQMKPDGAEAPVAGICHARGLNAALPPTWMIYIVVEHLEHAVAQCQALGGKVLIPPRPETGNVMAVLQDPAGAVFTVYQAQ